MELLSRLCQSAVEIDGVELAYANSKPSGAIMDLIPVIQLQNGHCVTLKSGRVEEPTIWHVDPVAKAKEFISAGASWIHVTDMDGVTREGENTDLITEITRTCGGSVQVGGGFATMDHIANAVEYGAGRIVIGSAAVTNPQFLEQAAKYYPDQIVLSVDVYQGQVTIDGWRNQTAFQPADFIDQFKNAPLAAILITDVAKEVGQSPDGSIGMVSALAHDLRAPVIGGGLIDNLDDVARLAYGHQVDAALIGRPLYEKAMEFSEAVATLAPSLTEAKAEFVQNPADASKEQNDSSPTR